MKCAVTRFFCCLLLLNLFLTLGCAPVGPDYSPPNLNIPDTWNEAQYSTADIRNASDRWWDLFRDPLLTELVDTALSANKTVAAAKSRVLAARAKSRIVGADTLPSANVSSSYNSVRKSDTAGSVGGEQNLFQFGFDASWELDLFGGQRRKVESATAAFAASEESLRDVLASLEAEIARNYFELRGTQNRLVTAKNNLTTQETTLATVQGRFRLGLASQMEVLQAETQKSMVATQIPLLERKIIQNINQLALLLATPAEAISARLIVPKDLPDLPDSLPSGLPSDLLRQRPDIRRAEKSLAAATADIGVATSDLFPKFSLSAALGMQTATFSELTSWESRFWTVGPGIKLPIFNREKLKAALSLSEANRDELLATYEQTVLAAITETENTLVQFSTEKQVYDQLREATLSGRQAAAFAEGLYKGGLTDLNDVLTSQRTLFQAEDQYIQSHQQLALTAVALYKALGGGWEISEKHLSPTPSQPSIK